MIPAKLNCDALAGCRLLLGGLVLLLATGCHAITPPGSSFLPESDEPLPIADQLQPSHNRTWSPDMAVLPYAEIKNNRITIHNIRNCTYRTNDEYVVKHYDKTFDLDRINEVDFILTPFQETPSLAHTMLSFGFEGDQYVSFSVEARLEKGETYTPVLGAMRQYELMYVVADEHDVILRRTKHRGADVYLYRTQATPEQARDLFLDVMRRVNRIFREPEFYDTVTNNCTTNLAKHVNRLRPNRVNLYDPRLLLPGYADNLAYDLGLLDQSKSFDQLRAEARINERVRQFADERNFSALIRR